MALQAVSSGLGSVKTVAKRVAQREIPLEKNLKEATSNENWAVPNSQLHDIARASFDIQEYGVIITEIWTGLQDSESGWRVIKNGPERIIDEVREQFKVGHLMDFRYSEDGTDKGASVLEKAASIGPSPSANPEEFEVEASKENLRASRDRVPMLHASAKLIEDRVLDEEHVDFHPIGKVPPVSTPHPFGAEATLEQERQQVRLLQEAQAAAGADLRQLEENLRTVLADNQTLQQKVREMELERTLFLEVQAKSEDLHQTRDEMAALGRRLDVREDDPKAAARALWKEQMAALRETMQAAPSVPPPMAAPSMAPTEENLAPRRFGSQDYEAAERADLELYDDASACRDSNSDESLKDVAVALRDFEAEEDVELPLQTKDAVVVTHWSRSGWAYGSSSKGEGWFPAHYVASSTR